MAKLKMVVGAIVLLLLTFCFSSFFAITTLARLYENSLNALNQAASSGSAPILLEINVFINQQIYVALLTLLAGNLSLLVMIAWRSLPAPEHWSLKTVGWPLFLVSGATQLIALAMYISNFIVVAPATQVIEAGLFDVVVEIITTLAISTLLFFELLILLLKLLQNDRTLRCSRSSAIDPSSIRPAIFLFLFGVDLSAAFVPLHMKNLYQPLLDLPKDMVLGLPISSMFLCVSFTIVVAGIWLDRRGWHEPFLMGLALTACAMLYAWLAPNGVHFIIAMGLVGLGYGLALMASQGFVIVHTDDKSKARGLAYLIAGIYAGSICGTAVGAMLAERIGYSPVFLFSAVTLFLTLGYTLLAMHGAIEQAKLHIRVARIGQAAAVVTAKHYWNFLRNRYVLGLIFLSSLPSAIAVIGLLNYFGPVYLDRLGVSQSIIGSVLILYSICMVYLGPFCEQIYRRLGQQASVRFHRLRTRGGRVSQLLFLHRPHRDGRCGAAVGCVELFCAGVADHLCTNAGCHPTTWLWTSHRDIPRVQPYRPDARPHFIWLADGRHRHQPGSYLLWHCLSGYSGTFSAVDFRTG